MTFSQQPQQQQPNWSILVVQFNRGNDKKPMDLGIHGNTDEFSCFSEKPDGDVSPFALG